MIPLAQYFAERGGDDFAPFRAVPAAASEPMPMRSLAQVMKAPQGERRTAGRPLKILDANLAVAPDKLARPAASPATARGSELPRRPAPAKTASVQAPATAGIRPAFAKIEPKRDARPAQNPPAGPLVRASELEAERTRFAQERAAWEAERREHKSEIDQAVVAARLEGMLNGRRMAREEMETEVVGRIASVRDELLAEHVAALTATRTEWTSDQADRLAAQVTQGLARLEAAIREAFQSVLRPLARDARRRQTVDELVEAIRTLALDGQSFKIAASGPADLLGAIGDRLGEQANLLSFAVDDSATDIRIDADNTVIETRLSSWQQALDEALS